MLLDSRRMPPVCGRPESRPKPRRKARVEPNRHHPYGTCFEYWEQGKCSTRKSGAVCKWEHVKANSPEATAYIAKAKAAAVKKEQAAPADGIKPKKNIACKIIKLGKYEKGKSCEYSHAGGAAAPATGPKNEQKGTRARKETTPAAAVEQEHAVVGAGPTHVCTDSDSS